MENNLTQRKGILCGGNWIVDHIKIIDTYPGESMLTDIRAEHKSVGGGPNNVLVNLAKLNTGIPLLAMGVIGDDADGEYVLKELSNYNIDINNIRKTDLKKTSFTDAMSVYSTGKRTFFHYRGANTLLDIQDFKLESNARIFHLAYLLLLDKLDDSDNEYGVVAARVLDNLQKNGYITSVDVVSSEDDRFKTVIRPCLPYIDYLIVNEIEAGRTAGRNVRTDAGKIDIEQVRQSAKYLIQAGTNKLVIIHFPEGGLIVDPAGNEKIVSSFVVDDSKIVGTIGAGDAFCAGCLYAIYEGFDHENILKYGHAFARFNLKDATSTGGAVSIEKIEAYLKTAQLNPSLA